MYRLKKPYELPEDIQVPQCMYQIKPVNKINLVRPQTLVNGNSSESSQESKITLVNGGGETQSAAKKNKRKRTISNPKSPEIAKEVCAKDKENRSEPKKEQQRKSEGNTNKKMTNDNKNKVENDDELREKIIAKLEARQNEVIKKLLHLRDMLNNASGATVVGTGSSATGQPTESVEAVVHADPANPPLSLLFLTKLLRDSYGPGGVTLKSYRHSSCQEQLSKSAQLLSQSSEETLSRNSVDISVIWKKVPDGEAQLLVAPTVQAPIRGEANVARYLSRLLPSGHPVNYDSLSWDDLIRVDGLLERAVDGPLDLSELEKQLQSHNPCLIGEASIADFVNFSVVAASVNGDAAKLKKYPQVLKWFSACQEYGAFKL